MEQPLQQLTTEIDGTTTFPNNFSRPIDSNIVGCVSDWKDINTYKPIRNPKLFLICHSIPNMLVRDIEGDKNLE